MKMRMREMGGWGERERREREVTIEGDGGDGRVFLEKLSERFRALLLNKVI